MKKHQLPSATQIREATGSAGGTGNRFEVVVLQEGLGNFRDAFYYTKPALESLCKIAEGKKIFANHPSAIDEEVQPERDVLKAFGHYENFRMQEGAGGQAECVADLVLCEGEAFDRERGLLQHAVKYSEKYKNQDFIGVSIYASGDSEEMDLDELIRQGVPKGCVEKLSQAKDLGVTQVKLAKTFSDCTSIDLVTEAGAGGRISKMLESHKETKQMAVKKNKETDTNPANKDGGTEKPVVAAKPAPDAGAHPDKDQDVALIKSMIDKYKGKAPDAEQEDESELGKKLKAAHEAALKLGHKGEEAEVEAVKHVQMAKHMAQAESESEAEAEKCEAEKKEKAKKEAETEAEAEAEVEKNKKEAATKIVKLTSENSALKEKLAKVELDKHIDKTLAESKQPMAATKKFRESIGDVKSASEFDRLFKVFMSARENTLSSEANADFSEAYVNPEREVVAATESDSDLDFAAAVAD
jgi:hypothetical protein